MKNNKLPGIILLVCLFLKACCTEPERVGLTAEEKRYVPYELNDTVVFVDTINKVELEYIIGDINKGEGEITKYMDFCPSGWRALEQHGLYSLSDSPLSSPIIHLYLTKRSSSRGITLDFGILSSWLDEHVDMDSLEIIENYRLGEIVYQDAFMINNTQHSDTIYEESMYRFNQAVIAKDGGLVKLWNTILDKGLILKEIR